LLHQDLLMQICSLPSSTFPSGGGIFTGTACLGSTDADAVFNFGVDNTTGAGPGPAIKTQFTVVVGASAPEVDSDSAALPIAITVIGLAMAGDRYRRRSA
ncbi:MAG TPA: hypothetical protein VGO93_31105, partial [Candidatus Xenobia bacterium]